MKISKRALGDLAAQIVQHALDGGFSRTYNIDLDEIEKVELAAHIKRSIALGVNRVVFDITENDQPQEDHPHD
jgi:hypothetical protein